MLHKQKQILPGNFSSIFQPPFNPLSTLAPAANWCSTHGANATAVNMTKSSKKRKSFHRKELEPKCRQTFCRGLQRFAPCKGPQQQQKHQQQQQQHRQQRQRHQQSQTNLKAKPESSFNYKSFFCKETKWNFHAACKRQWGKLENGIASLLHKNIHIAIYRPYLCQSLYNDGRIFFTYLLHN